MSKKPKEDDVCNKTLVDYLRKQNRPFNVAEIELNLKKEFGFGKSLVTRCLENLAQSGKIKEKVYGKQKIYFALQDTIAVPNDEMQKSELTIRSNKAEIAQLEKAIKDLEAAIMAKSRRPNGAQLRKEIEELKEGNSKLEDKLKELKETAKGADPAKQKVLKKKREKVIGEWRKRKRIANNILDMILEGYPKTKKALLEEIGIDTDEDAGVTCPRD